MPRVQHIFRWDLDKTYLRTEFDSMRSLVRTARLSAEERENIPGSAALIRAIRNEKHNGRENLIYFISGSPRQLRTVIERKFALDGFTPDGFVLKPSVSNFFRGRFRAIRNQIPYKLGALLRGRSEATVGTRETLLGDDAESDAFIYSLYADIIAGTAGADVVRKILRRSAAYEDEIAYVEHEMNAVIHENAVDRIVIHLDQLTPPAAFNEYFPRVVPIYNHLQTAIVLCLDGALGVLSIRQVAHELIARFGFDRQRLTNSSEDIVRRLRSQYPQDRLRALAEALEGMPPPLEGDATAETREVLVGIAERVRYLEGRPPSSFDTMLPRPLDYVALFERDEALREAARKLRKSDSVKRPSG